MNEKINKARRDKIWFVVLLGLAVIFFSADSVDFY